MKQFFLFFLTAILNTIALAQDGTHDLTFNPTDVGRKYGDGPYYWPTSPYPQFNKIAIQTDGKILCTGLFTEYNGFSCRGIMRLTPDGNFDPTFNSGGSGLTGKVNAIIIQSDGKIVLGGYFDYNGESVQNVIRLHADGSLDTGFNVNIGQGGTEEVGAMIEQPDGKIVLAGKFYPGGLMRVDANGIVDPTFISAEYGFSMADIYALSLQPDGKILVSGAFRNYGGVPAKNLLRLHDNGTLDTAFDTSVGADAEVRDMVVMPDGKIIVVGAFTYYNGTYRPNIARLTANGTLDTTFNPGYFRENGTVSAELFSILLQQDGKFLVGGKFKLHGATPIIANATTVGNVVRLNANGTRDVSFNTAGADAQIYDMAIQPNGQIVSAGLFETYGSVCRRRISRSTANGMTDMTFNTGSGANSSVYDCKILPDDKIMIAGHFRLYNGVVRNRIAKLHADGTLDASFNSNLVIDESIVTFEIQPDGKIIIAGHFTTVGGMPRSLIARLNADGSMDSTFDIGTGFLGIRITDIAIQPDGKILTVGYFTGFNGVTCNRIARLNANGSLDTTFNIGTAANDHVSSVAVQSDGKIIICGTFNVFNGVAKRGILRLLPNGSIDNTFETGSGLLGNVTSITTLADGKILLAGRLEDYNGFRIHMLARLNQNGSLDETFHSFSNSGTVLAVSIRPDGKILFVGQTDSSGAIFSIHDPEGNYNSEFPVYLSSGPNNVVNTVGSQSDGKVIIGGQFNIVDNVGRNRIARINAPSMLNVNTQSNETTNIMVYGHNNKLIVDAKDHTLNMVYVYDSNGKLLYENQNIAESKFVIENIKSSNQMLILKCIDNQGKISNVKTIF